MEPSTLTRNLQPLVAAGWVVVEAEQDPAVAPSYRYAKKGFETRPP